MIKFAKQGDVNLRALEPPHAKVRQLLWGDFLRIEGEFGEFFKVKWGTRQFLVPKDECQDTRPLEVVFVDVGQGDGCLLVSPEVGDEEKVLLIDAGERRNMYNFVKWRFGGLKKKFPFHAAVVTHSDQDHYGGFQPFFADENCSFKTVHHNGIAEREKPQDLFGPSDPTKKFLIDIIATDAQMRALYADPLVRGRKQYAKLMDTAITSGRVEKFEMLSAAHGTLENGRSWVPGFSPSESPNLTIEVLGPVVEPDTTGAPQLRWFGDTPTSNSRNEGKTKNGHSVLLRLTHHNFTLLFGGDLNTPAEHFLLRHYAGLPANRPLSEAVVPARPRFRSDVMKSCHHGAADVTDEFMDAVQPFAFTVSSGDSEGHVHPRPDLLGRLGRHGRGDAPLILCTEILRSGREREDEAVLKKIRKFNDQIEDPATSADDRTTLKTERNKALQFLGRRNVEVYGAITLRTDGENLVIAFRFEEAKKVKVWQIYSFKHDPVEGFVPVS